MRLWKQTNRKALDAATPLYVIKKNTWNLTIPRSLYMYVCTFCAHDNKNKSLHITTPFCIEIPKRRNWAMPCSLRRMREQFKTYTKWKTKITSLKVANLMNKNLKITRKMVLPQSLYSMYVRFLQMRGKKLLDASRSLYRNLKIYENF